MDGLECSEIYKLDVLNNEYRVDAEYYKKRYLIEDYNISQFPIIKIGDFAFVTDGQHGYHEIDVNSPIHMLTAKNTKDWFADIDDAETIAKWVDDNNKRSSLKDGDVVLSTRGTVGKCAIVKRDILPANLDQDVARINILGKRISSEYLLCYLNSIYGQDWMIRNKTGMVQQGLSLQKVRQMPVPVLNDKFQTIIKDTVNKAYVLKNECKNEYNKAEELLLTKLGMNDFALTEKSINVRNLSESFGAVGRLDAEYYQPKYETYTKELNTTETVSALCNIYDENYNPLDETDYHYIELANVGAYGNISDATVSKGKYLPTRARRRVKAGEVIVSSVEGSLQSCALITDEYDGALCSTGFYVLDSNVINPETLLVLFKSKVMQELMKQRCSGTILTAISKDELLSMPLPEISVDIQKEIAKEIQSSFILRRQSKQLLDCAVKAVEMAIEQSEEKATAWLNEKIKEIESL